MAERAFQKATAPLVSTSKRKSAPPAICSAEPASGSIRADHVDAFFQFRPSNDKQKTKHPLTMKTKRYTPIEPAVMTIGQVCLLLMMFIVVPF